MLGEGAVVKEMEAAAVAWVCQQLGVPFVALKTVTDLVDGAAATRAEFDANLRAASHTLQQKLVELLRLLDGHRLNQLALPAPPGTAAAAPTADAPTLTRRALPDAPTFHFGGGSRLATMAALVLAGVAVGAGLARTVRR